MALNLWKLGGQPTAFNPLPQGWLNKITIPIGNYNLRFVASVSNLAQLKIGGDNSSLKIEGSSSSYTVTNVTDKYIELSVSNTQPQNLYFLDGATANGNGNISVKNIELVQKPLPKMTINGIDGFLSGKWSLHANAKAIDDETLELNATAGAQVSELLIPALPNQQYTINIQKNSDRCVLRYQYVDNSISADKVINNTIGDFLGTFTTEPNVKGIYVRLYSSGVGTFTFKRPQLNLGTTPAPYSKKTGERMVKPVPKKNLFDNTYAETTGYTKLSSGVEVSVVGFIRSSKMNVKQNTQYTLSALIENISGVTMPLLSVRKGSDNVGIINLGASGSVTFNTGSETQIHLYAYGWNEIKRYTNIQLEEGTTATPYEPYAVQMNPKPKRSLQAKKGLAFLGDSYLQLPSMTMDSIEIDCLIDSVQVKNPVNLIDFRTGSATSGFASDSVGTNISKIFVNNLEIAKTWANVPKNERIKLKIQLNTPVTDDVAIFTDYLNRFNLKGTIYSITPFLNGVSLVTYDTTNPNNIIGDKVIPNAKNLIPSFEDSKWSLHANFKVLGKDVGRLEATAQYQHSSYIVNATPNKDYLFLADVTGTVYVEEYDVNNVRLSTIGLNKSVRHAFKTNANTKEIRIFLSSGLTGTGSLDFIKPQLYELSGKEGTLFGKPTPLNKQAKRSLYAKR